MSRSSPRIETPGSQSPGARHTNRLIRETSPYLLQHAHNPVEWHPWGPEAFDVARREDKPIFLSIGYSTCYWCHVMERECFENEAVAAIMNSHFVSIKVDREERPDVDDLYMSAVQLLTGQGGWPMSVFLEPESLRPFVAGTYFPPEDRFGRPGFPSVLRHIAKMWREQRQGVLQQAEQVAEAVRAALTQTPEPVGLGREHVMRAVNELLRSYDAEHGGFGATAPKFPMPANLDLLIAAAWDQPHARNAVLHTLDRMAMGGMYDQVGGGFHRYSVDEHWLVPHFEKMLYDNGQLCSTYAAAFERTHDPFYAEVVAETLDYALREMRDAGGAFWSAQDAEVNAREGQNYLWTAADVRETLASAGLAADSELAIHIYGLDRGSNFRDPHHPEDGPKNVLFLIDKPAKLAESLGMSLDAFNDRVRRVNNALLEARNKRDQPGTDDKVIAGWNGLMIAGMADGGRALGEDRFIEAAQEAARFILREMRTPDGGLRRTYRRGEARIDAFLEDYALLIHGLLAVHRANGSAEMHDAAVQLADAAKERFWDSRTGGCFDTLADQADLFVRTKSYHDGAVPCGNSVMMLNLLDLHRITGEARFLDDAAATLRALSAIVAERSTVAVLSVLALHRMLEEHPDRVIAGEGKHAESQSPVRIDVQPAKVTLPADGEAAVTLTLHIAEGYHINANRPGPGFLTPLEVELSGEGWALEVEYPPGEPFEAGVFGGERIAVHTGEVSLPVKVRRTGRVGGVPQLAVTYQACTDIACLMPRVEIVPLELEAR